MFLRYGQFYVENAHFSYSPLFNPEINKKFELMLTRRAKAYSSSGSVV